MRRIAFLFVVFVSFMLVVPCFAVLPPVTDGLVGCWDFEEGSGTTAIDSSGNGNNGVITKAIYTNDTPSQIVSMFALRFNTTTTGFADSYVIIPDSPSLRPNSSLTLAAWVKTSVVQSRPAAIIGKQYSYALYDSYCLWYEWGYLNFYLRTATSQKYISIAQPSTNEWHHIVGTYDGTFMRLYVDGVERVNGTFTGSIVYDNLPLSIGADSDRADHLLHQGWDGLIDEVLIYNRALNPAEIMQIIHPATTLYGIIGNHLVTIDQTTGSATEVGEINATDLWGMTYDPYRDALYCVANQTTDPELVIIDQVTANATVVGPIDLEGYPSTYLGFVEALAFNSVDGKLYASAGTTAYLSPMLIRIDPATGNGTQIASITGTSENDGDSMVFVKDTLYLIDSTPISALYTVNLSTGLATYIGNTTRWGVILAYNPETQTLLGSARADRLLVEVSPLSGQCTDIGPTHTADEFKGALLGLMTVVFDGRPPQIDIPIQDPSDNVQPYENVTISTNVTDNLSGVKNVSLAYSLDNATSWEELKTMNYNATTGSYESLIPGQPTGTWVKYKIVAFDYMGNNASLEGEQSYLAYQVVPEFPMLLMLPLFIAATLMALVVLKKRNRVQLN